MASPHLHFPDFFSLLQRGLPDRFARTPRKITPAQLMGVLCVMTGFGRKGYRRVVAELQSGLGRAFGWFDQDSIPSAQALCQARQALSRGVCDEAFAGVYRGCTQLMAAPVASYGGLRLLGMDGTRLSLPPTPELVTHFGCPSNHHGSAEGPMAGLVQIWDVGRNCPVAFELTTCDFNERETSERLFQHLGPTDLLIGDRGYPSYDWFRALCRRRARFLIRCPIQAGTVYGDFAASGQDETVILLTKRDHRQRRIPGTPAIPMRLLRITLPSGAVEVLATNLWQPRGHDRETLGRLYTQRWRIETTFREMKVYHALEHFSATYPDGIYQEIVAIQIFLMLTSELEALARTVHAQAEPTLPTSPPSPSPSPSPPSTNLRPPPPSTLIIREVRFNRLLIADNVIHLLRAAATGGADEVARRLPRILTNLWKNRSYVKPGRIFPRHRKRALGRFRNTRP